MSAAVSSQAARNIAVNSGIRGVMPNSQDAMWIVSIFPFPREEELQLGSFLETEEGTRATAGFRKFELPAAARTRYRIMKVEGGLKWLNNFSDVGEGQETPTPEPIWQSAEIVSRSLIESWTKHTLGTRGTPGIKVLQPADMKAGDNGEVELDKEGNPVPTRSCLEGLREIQTEYAQSCVERASDLHMTGKTTSIPGLDRGMASWLYGNGANKLPWFPKQEFRDLKECPNCGQDILATALGCQLCSVNLPRFYMEMAMDPAGDTVVAAAVKRIREAEKANTQGIGIAPLPSEIAAIEAKPESARTRTERDKIRAHRGKLG